MYKKEESMRWMTEYKNDRKRGRRMNDRENKDKDRERAGEKKATSWNLLRKRKNFANFGNSIDPILYKRANY